MQFRQLGRSGVRVSQVGLGTDQFGPRVDRAATARIVGAALEAGINFFDTADIYSLGESESYLGAALQGHRHEVVIATKAGRPFGKGTNDAGSSRTHLVRALEASLVRLGTDYVDLYQIHIYDPTTPMDELMRTLDDMVSSGKVRYLGASNFSAWQVCRCNDIAEAQGRAPFVTVQPHYHLLEREVEREMLPYCRMFGVGVLPYFPLAAGVLTGRYTQAGAPPADSRSAVGGWQLDYVNRYRTPENWARLESLTAWAAERGHTLADLAIAWLLGEPLVPSVIAGASKAEHVTANAAAGDWALTADEMAAVRAILEG